jgi:ATP-dependent Lon protease
MLRQGLADAGRRSMLALTQAPAAPAAVQSSSLQEIVMSPAAVPSLELPPGVVALIPMRNLVLFPHVLAPVNVGRAKSIAALEHALAAGVAVGIVLQKDPREDDPGLDGLHAVGTLAKVVHHIEPPQQQNVHHTVCQGTQRFRITGPAEGYPFLAARIEPIAEPGDSSAEAEALAIQLHERTVELLSLLPSVPAEAVHALQAMRGPAQLADITASLIDAELDQKQALLETIAPQERVRKLLPLLSHRIEVLRLSKEIGERTKEQLDDRQRKFLLREQLKTIQQELGENGGADEEIAGLEEAIAKAGMPPDAEAHARKELRRLQNMSDASGEYSMLRTYLEWMVELPWATPVETPIDLQAARRTLEADHFGLERVKRRIVEFLAVRKLNPTGRAPIL